MYFLGDPCGNYSEFPVDSKVKWVMDHWIQAKAKEFSLKHIQTTNTVTKTFSHDMTDLTRLFYKENHVQLSIEMVLNWAELSIRRYSIQICIW